MLNFRAYIGTVCLENPFFINYLPIFFNRMSFLSSRSNTNLLILISI